MAIRVTTPLLIDTTMRDIDRNLKTLQEIQYRLTTGRRINKPSDDPVGVVDALKLRGSISSTVQHQKNVDDGKGRLNATLRALETLDTLLVDVQTVTQAALDDPSSGTHSIYSQEVNGLLNEIILNANAKYLGKYIFGGHESLTPPYTETRNAFDQITDVARNPNGIDDLIDHTVAEGLDMAVNVSGSAPFMPNGEGNTDDVFNTIIRIRDSLAVHDMTAVRAAYDELESEFENIVVQATIAGERLSRIETTRDTNEELNVVKQEGLSEIMNTDFAEDAVNLNYQRFLYETSLQVGARIIPPTLLDFI